MKKKNKNMKKKKEEEEEEDIDILNIWFTLLLTCISLALFRRNSKMHGPSCKIILLC
jgi:hypothetical protein